jgi:hypothetical protein
MMHVCIFQTDAANQAHTATLCMYSCPIHWLCHMMTVLTVQGRDVHAVGANVQSWWHSRPVLASELVSRGVPATKTVYVLTSTSCSVVHLLCLGADHHMILSQSQAFALRTAQTC